MAHVRESELRKFDRKQLCTVLFAHIVILFLLILQSKFQTTNLYFLAYLRYENRTGRVSYRFRNRRRYITSRPQFLINNRWRRVTQHRGKVSVHFGLRYWRVKVKRGRPIFQARKPTWKRLSYKSKKSRTFQRYIRRTRRLRRDRRRERRQDRRIRRKRRRISPLKIYYRRKTRKIYKWRGNLTFRLLGRRRKIR